MRSPRRGRRTLAESTMAWWISGLRFAVPSALAIKNKGDTMCW